MPSSTTQDLRKIAGVSFALPLHTAPEGPTDPSQAKLPANFTVLVAGASRGIGRGIAKAYARAKVPNLILSARSQETLEEAAKEVIKISPRTKILCQACDITDDDQIKELVEATTTAFGRLDVLVINAGTATKVSVKRESGLMDWPNNFLEQDAQEMENLWKLNVHAPFILMREVLPLLEQTEDGAKAIIQLSSAAAHYTPSDIMAASYSLTKLGATRLVELCHEGHKKNGIVAFAVQPGGVKTDLSSSVPEGKGWEQRKCIL